jgi:hypothetical protein
MLVAQNAFSQEIFVQHVVNRDLVLQSRRAGRSVYVHDNRIVVACGLLDMLWQGLNEEIVPWS